MVKEETFIININISIYKAIKEETFIININIPFIKKSAYDYANNFSIKVNKTFELRKLPNYELEPFNL